MIQEFKEFINRGNVVDLAVAVVIGTAFGAVITSFTTDILGGVLAAIGGEPDLRSAFVIDVGDGRILVGSFLTAIINFLIIAFAVFLVVKAINAAQSIRQAPEEQVELAEDEIDVLKEIRDLLRQQR
jgi:large conductance mechanosensitive channel